MGDAMSGTAWLLGSGYPWPSGGDGGVAGAFVVANSREGLSLAAMPSGALGLASSDDSLGQLVLPRGIAVDGATLYVLSHDGDLVYRYDALGQSLDPLPHVGMHGLCGAALEAPAHAPRRFRGAAAIAALHGALYVADREARRVQVFDLKTLALLGIHDDIGVPVDLASGADAVYILDGLDGRVYRAARTCDTLQLAVSPPPRTCGATLPDRIAVDTAGRIYLRRRRQEPELQVFDLSAGLPATCPREHIADSAQVRDRFAKPAVTMDGAGVLSAPAWLLDPCGARRPLPEGARRWQVGSRLYVFDPVTRTLSVRLADGRLRHRWGPLDAGGNEVAGDSDDAWLAADGVAIGATAWILDERHQRIYAHREGDGALRYCFGAPADAPRHWRRIAPDGDGCLLLWDTSADLVERYTLAGAPRGALPLRSVRRQFDDGPGPAPQWPAVELTRAGGRPAPARAAPAWPPARYRQQGVWTSQWLDSEIHDCQWHLIELDATRLPPGASIRLRSRTTNEAPAVHSTSPGLPGSWDDMPGFIASAQPEPGKPTRLQTDLLVQSSPGQYLQLQVELTGNGLDTPVVDHLRLRFPRESLLDYLPALYSSSPGQQAFLDRLLAIAQTTWAGIESEVDSFERYIDPDSVPDHALAWLADWMDVKLEGTWKPEQNRRLLQAMPRLRARWGTPDGLRDWVRVYLANLSGIDEAALAQLGVPAIVESFVERRQLLLGDAGAMLGSAQPLWSPAAERRFQVGVFDRLGEIELVSTGEPDTDALRHYAHGFRVHVPAELVRTPADEAMLRRAIEAQKPAHATYRLQLTEARLCIGMQSTIGLDTIIAAPGPGTLPCPARPDAPGRPPYQRLGFDTILAAGNDTSGSMRPTRVLI
jgi:phage tail-like protein